MTVQKNNPWDLDVRVRDRNIRRGVVDPKEVEKFLKELPDSAANAIPIEIAQPALSGAVTAGMSAPVTKES